MSSPNKLLLVGWDAADWKSISPLVDAGKMPILQRLIENGVMGNLATIQPVLSPMLWTSIATGKRPFKHGIHGFSEPDPHTGKIRPITNLSRKTKALWNILCQNGLRTNVVGWWPSHPAEPVDGVMVSNHFHRAVAALDRPWPLRPGTVHPPELGGSLAAMRVHPGELEGDLLRLFVPGAPQIDQEKDKRLATCAKIIAEAAGIHAAATWILSEKGNPGYKWDFMAVYYDAIDHFCHAFMRYHPPKQDRVSKEDFDLYNGVVEAGYRYHDLMLGTLLHLAGEDTTVILISDHGFHPDALRPLQLPNEPAGPAAEHRPFGIFVACGPDIRKDDLVFGASILDVAPTVLTHFHLPVGQDMDGRPLLSLFREEPAVRYVASWDAILPRAGCSSGEHPPEARLDPVESSEALAQLVALGYIDEPDTDAAKASRDTIGELQYNVARAYADAQRHHEAAALFESLWNDWPEESRYGVHLFHSQLALGYLAAARSTLERVRSRKQEYALTAARELKELRESLLEKQREAKANGNPPQEAEAGETTTPLGAEDGDRIDWEKCDRRTQHRWRKLQAQARQNPLAFFYLEGCLLHAEGRYEEAVNLLQRAAGSEPHKLQSLYQKIGETQLALRQPDAAAESFGKALAFDGINPAARLGLARAHFRRQRYAETAAEALAASGQMFHNPPAHCLAGMALHRLGRVAEAKMSLQNALVQNPVYPAAHRALAAVYQDGCGDWTTAAEHRRLAREARARIREWKSGGRPAETKEEIAARFIPGKLDPGSPGFAAPPASFDGSGASALPPLARCITVVSGLPRSGTSMVMQMLHAGGLEILTDHEREADESNPRGYFELERVKSLGKESPAWLAEAAGKAVKIVSPLLRCLPAVLHGVPSGTGEGVEELRIPTLDPLFYRVLLLERPLDEVARSQSSMLERLGKSDRAARLAPQALIRTLQREFEQTRRLLGRWIERRPEQVAVLSLSYHDTLANPAAAAKKIHAFLGGSLDEAAMAAAIDSSLYRERPQRIPC